MSMHDCAHASIHIDSLHCLSVMRRRRETKGGSLIEKCFFHAQNKIAKIDSQTYLWTSKSSKNSWTINQKCRHVWDKYKVRKEKGKRIIFCCKQWWQVTYLCWSWWRNFFASQWCCCGLGWEGCALCLASRPINLLMGHYLVPGMGPTYCLLCHARILDYVILVQMYQVPGTVDQEGCMSRTEGPIPGRDLRPTAPLYTPGGPILAFSFL